MPPIAGKPSLRDKSLIIMAINVIIPLTRGTLKGGPPEEKSGDQTEKFIIQTSYGQLQRSYQILFIHEQLVPIVGP